MQSVDGSQELSLIFLLCCFLFGVCGWPRTTVLVGHVWGQQKPKALTEWEVRSEIPPI